ncbi:MAG: YgaP family membrane protein [bacterium]
MKNEGGIDRIVRIIAGLALIGSVYTIPAMNPWGWIGVVPLVTGIIGWCPAYSLFGIKTCKAK